VYTYEVRLANSRSLYETTPKVNTIFHVQYTYEVRRVNSRCLHKTPPTNEAIVRVYLPSSPNQLALIVRDKPQIRDN
jgi:hypothetical protein